MKTYLYLALCLSSYSAVAQNAKALDQKNGFRDVTFGADTSALVGRVKHQTKNPLLSIYHRPTDELKIGGASLEDISYIYYKGKLSDVLIHTKGLANSRALYEALTANFGKAYRHNQFLQDFDWTGKVVSMNYEENEVTGDAKVFISSRALAKQQQQDEAAAAKASKSDL